MLATGWEDRSESTLHELLDSADVDQNGLVYFKEFQNERSNVRSFECQQEQEQQEFEKYDETVEQFG